MINNIDEYLHQLKKELANCDRATIQDALSDAEEYLRNAVENLRKKQPGVPEESVFRRSWKNMGRHPKLRRLIERSKPAAHPPSFQAPDEASLLLSVDFSVW